MKEKKKNIPLGLLYITHVIPWTSTDHSIIHNTLQQTEKLYKALLTTRRQSLEPLHWESAWKLSFCVLKLFTLVFKCKSASLNCRADSYGLENVLIFPKNRSSISYVYTKSFPHCLPKGPSSRQGHTESHWGEFRFHKKHTHNTNQKQRLAKSLLLAAILNTVGYACWLIVEVEATLRRARGILIRLRLHM